MATSVLPPGEETKPKKAGRRPRDLHRASMAIDATAFALAEKMVLMTASNRTAVLEEAVRDLAKKRGVTVTPEEVDQLLGRPIGTTAQRAKEALQGVQL